MDLDEIRERVRKRRASKNSEAQQKWCLIYDSGIHGFFKVLASENELQLVTDELEKEGMPQVLAQYLSEEELDSNFDSDTRDIADKDSIEPAQEVDIAGLTTSFYEIIEDDESCDDDSEYDDSFDSTDSYEYVKAKVIDIISKELSINKSKIFSYSQLEHNLRIYLQDLRKIIMEIEDEFDIVIPDFEVDDFKSVGDIISYVKQNINN